MPGSPGHTGVVTKLIRDARENRGNMSVLWLDLVNSYGPTQAGTLTIYYAPRIRDC